MCWRLQPYVLEAATTVCIRCAECDFDLCLQCAGPQPACSPAAADGVGVEGGEAEGGGDGAASGEGSGEGSGAAEPRGAKAEPRATAGPTAAASGVGSAAAAMRAPCILFLDSWLTNSSKVRRQRT